jgi:hypothetical protein
MPNKSGGYHYEPTGELRLDDNSQVWPGSAAGNEAHHFVPFGLRSLGQLISAGAFRPPICR